MNPWMQIPEKTPGKFRVGDRVRILHGYRGMIGEVVENRGRILASGRRLYGVKLRLDEWNEHTTELPEESLEAVEAEPDAKPRTRSTAGPEESDSRRSGRARKEH